MRYEERRSRGDLIEAYKIICVREAEPWKAFPELARSKATQWLNHKLFKKLERIIRAGVL